MVAVGVRDQPDSYILKAKPELLDTFVDQGCLRLKGTVGKLGIAVHSLQPAATAGIG